MNTYQITLSNITEYQLALFALKNWGDQIISRDSDTLSLEVTELGLAMVEGSIGRRVI